MTALPRDPVIHTLRNPVQLPATTPAEWEQLVRLARSADLLARIASRLDAHQLLKEVPASPRTHLLAAQAVSGAQQAEVRREVAHLLQDLAPVGVPIVLLKGAAYLCAGLPAAEGRVFSDLDILVPKSRLGEVEARLMFRGWVTTHHSAYDQRYYRQWMHELPPLQHMHRQTVLDVHHAILPETARLKPESAKLLAAAVPVAGAAGLHVLAPADMVLHSMTHLFHNEELSHGLRDLSDIDLLLRHFGTAPAFWPELLERARELDLARPLHYGLRYAARVLGTPVPDATLAAAAQAAPGPLLSTWMDGLWLRALRSPHALSADGYTPAALLALYLRAHWLRMPPWLLFRHLLVKATRREPRDAAAPNTPV